MDDKKFREEVYKRHIKQLKNLEISHKKLIICFSGVPLSGKTYIARILEEKYKAVRINNDDIREIVKNVDKSKNMEEDVYSYLNWFLDNYRFKNGLVILDSSIDRRYPERAKITKKNKFKIFIIRLKVRGDILEKRLISGRKKEDKNHFYGEIERWSREWKEFGRNVKPDILIENNNKLNLIPLFDKLEGIIR